MEAKARAEKMASHIIGAMGKATSASVADRQWLINNLAAQIEEAEREAVDKEGEMMEARTRAEKIVYRCTGDPLSHEDIERFRKIHWHEIAHVASEIEEAEREAVYRFVDSHTKSCADAYAEGFRAGQKEAEKEFRSMDALQTYQLGIKDGFHVASEKAKRIVQERMEQNDIAANLYTLPENKLAKKVQAWMFDVAQRIGEMEP